MTEKNWIGDKGYIGNNMITLSGSRGGELLRLARSNMKLKIRWMIEQ